MVDGSGEVMAGKGKNIILPHKIATNCGLGVALCFNDFNVRLIIAPTVWPAVLYKNYSLNFKSHHNMWKNILFVIFILKIY